MCARISAGTKRPDALTSDCPDDAKPLRRRARALEDLNKTGGLPHPCGRASRYHDREWGPTLETEHAKADHDDSVAGPGRHFRGDCADGWFAKPSRTSIDELGAAIAPG